MSSDSYLALHPPLRKISRPGPLAVPLMRPSYQTDSIFHPHLIPSHSAISSTVNFYMSATYDPSHISASILHSLLPVLILTPSQTLKFNLQLLFTIKNYIQVLSSVSVWWRALQGGSCSGRGCGVAACLWHSGWIWEQPSVWRAFAPLPVFLMIW